MVAMGGKSSAEEKPAKPPLAKVNSIEETLICQICQVYIIKINFRKAGGVFIIFFDPAGDVS